ncbi:MAG: hypothetical protein ACOCVF_01190 [bacterium]
MSKLKVFPWDNGEKPFWINPENGFEWYYDESITGWANEERPNNNPPLNAMGFIVTERKGDKIIPCSRVLIDKKTNQVLADETSLDGMGVKIDMLRFAKKLLNKKSYDF